MKTKLLFAGLLLFMLCKTGFSQGTWTTLTPFIDSLENGVGVAIGQKGYVGLGDNPIGNQSYWWEYDPALNSWSQQANFPGGARGKSTAFAIDNFGYVGGGATIYKDFYKYDPAGNSWSSIAAMPGNLSYTVVSFVVNGKGYVGTGASGFSFGSQEFWEYDPLLNAWSQKANFGGVPRRHAMGFSIGCKGYIGCGWNQQAFSYYQDFWEYDPVLDAWSQKANYPHPTEGGAGFSIGNKGYIGLGVSLNGLYKDFYEYDPTANSWTAIPNLPGSERNRTAWFVIDSTAYVGTGSGPDTLKNDFYKYEPFNYDTTIVCCAILVDESRIHETCGNGNGSATVTQTGGTTPVTYQWSNGATASITTGLSSGNYFYTVTDSSGCKWLDSIAILNTGVTAVSAISNATDSLTCDGEATAFASGGVSPYTYAWGASAGNQTTSTATGLCDGTYIVTVTDNNGCSDTATVVISWPKCFTIASSVTNVNCNGGSNGAVNITIAGGNPPYTYQWSNSATTEDISGIGAGTYTVTVTSSSGGGNTIFYTDDFNSGGSNWTLNTTDQSSVASGNNRWIINSAYAAGNENVAFSFVTCGDFGCFAAPIGAVPNEPAGITGSPQSNYLHILVDPSKYGCSQTLLNAHYLVADAGAICSQPAENYFAEMNIGINTVGRTNVKLKFWWLGSTSAAAYGEVYYSTNGGISWISGLSNLSGQSTWKQDSLQVAAFDNQADLRFAFRFVNGDNGGSGNDPAFSVDQLELSVPSGATSCTLSQSFTVSEPSAFILQTFKEDVTCGGSNDGTATVLVGGGTSPYSYSWSPPISGQTNLQATGLSAGTYTVTITDSKSCTSSASFTITQSGNLSAATSSSGTSCGNSNGTATVTPSGGILPYTFVWTGGQSDSTATGLPAGTYSVTVTDGGGCTKIDSAIVSASTAPTASTTSTQTGCGINTGTATVTAGGGTPPYTYNWSNSQTNSVATGLAVGNHSVTVTDINTCTVTSSVSVSSSGGPSTVMTSANITCYGDSDGSATLTASGGSPPYTYVWSNGATTSNIQNQVASNYSVTVTDAGGCSALDSAIITQPTAILVSFNINNATCGSSDGAVAATVAGGTSPYTYLWSNSATTSLISTLASGTYLITVTDAGACTKKDSAMVFSVGEASISLTAITPVTCYGGSDGAISINTSGGTIPYTYSWSNGATTEDISGIAAGDFYLTLTDNSNCSSFDTFTVSEPAAITISAFKQDASCGGSDGTAWVNVTGGTPGYIYNWSSLQTTDSIFGIAAGNYSITISDINGCSENASVAINEAGAAILSIDSIKNISCNGGSNGLINISVTGGVSPYTFIWSDSSTTQNIDSLTAGNYFVTVTDAKGCKSFQDTTITQPLPLSSVTTNTNETCSSYGTAAVAAAGGTSPYTYLWSNSSTTSNIQQLTSDIYTVTISDLKNCTTFDTAIVSLNDSVTAVITGDDELCTGDNSLLTAQGGGTYLWKPGNQSTQDITVNPSVTTIYSVIVSQGSCSDTAFYTVVVNPAVNVNAGKDTSIYIEGSATLNGTITGGTAPFTYSWKPGNQSTQDITVTPTTTTGYLFSVVDARGCSVSDSVVVNVLPCDAEVFVPNAFAPGCGYNCKDNKLKVFSDCIETMQFFVYDRWGEMVYESSDPKKGWDGMYLGKPMNAAAYVYYLKYTTINAPDEVKVMEGNVNLIR